MTKYSKPNVKQPLSSSQNNTDFTPGGQCETTLQHHPRNHKCLPKCLNNLEAHTQTKNPLRDRKKYQSNTFFQMLYWIAQAVMAYL